ncbi:hypothetical protein H072_3287 [Dactylellina haptotyla CBS 200.50]|uniref:Uncharacterized protein n=1 Tax=Dactylellina haptotyla (strain CBS 200.50) TaxID=1284197 RepID=S8AI23_DACHA|nr:hypothetical protein H072_3287 [Dactylellina haptotyla CBS 200.50]
MVWRTIIAVLPALGQAINIDGLDYNRRNEQQQEGNLIRREFGIDAMCSWELPSSAIIRDQLYVNGGKLKRANITSLGSAPSLEVNDIPTFSYYLNLGNGFNTSEVPFQTIDTPFAQVTDGFMAANDNSFWLYGGLLVDTDSIQSFPAADNIQVYDAYRQGPSRVWTQGFQTGAALSNNVNRYVTAGAGVNVRELNTTYYFSGARNTNWTEIRGDGAVRERYRANVTSDQFISADLSDQVRTQWTNVTLDPVARPRVNAEMVYVPAGKLGVLVVLGGVSSADWLEPTNAEIQSGAFDAAINKSVTTGPSYLQQVELYDINSKKWYLQNTTGDVPPTGLAEFCATVATSKDGKTHNIYIYGGYPGQGETLPLPVYDDVYVLSLPAFEWIKVSSGSSATARRGHKCVKPLPDQMFIVGGAPANSAMCIDIIRIFNLNKLEFETEYKPSTYEEYKVPGVIASVIGGNTDGGATKTVSRWAAPTIQAMFISESPPQRAATWYPYSPVAASNTPTYSVIQTKSTTPKFVYPVVAVCIVLILAIIGGCIAFFCIRKGRQRRAAKEAGNEQFQPQQEKDKGYQQYPADINQYGSHGSMSTIAPAYQAGDQYSGNPQIVFELPAEPKGPAELDSGADYPKLGIIDENRANDNFSIVPTPATERSDPISAASRNPSTRTRRSIFSEATSPIDSPHGVSPLTPDPEIAGGGGNGTAPAEYSWWRKQSIKGGAVARKFSSFSSLRSLTRTQTSNSDIPTAAPVPVMPIRGANLSNTNITPPSIITPSITPPPQEPPVQAPQSESISAPPAPKIESAGASANPEGEQPTPPPAPTNTN